MITEQKRGGLTPSPFLGKTRLSVEITVDCIFYVVGFGLWGDVAGLLPLVFVVGKGIESRSVR